MSLFISETLPINERLFTISDLRKNFETLKHFFKEQIEIDKDEDDNTESQLIIKLYFPDDDQFIGEKLLSISDVVGADYKDNDDGDVDEEQMICIKTMMLLYKYTPLSCVTLDDFKVVLPFYCYLEEKIVPQFIDCAKRLKKEAEGGMVKYFATGIEKLLENWQEIILHLLILIETDTFKESGRFNSPNSYFLLLILMLYFNERKCNYLENGAFNFLTKQRQKLLRNLIAFWKLVHSKTFIGTNLNFGMSRVLADHLSLIFGNCMNLLIYCLYSFSEPMVEIEKDEAKEAAPFIVTIAHHSVYNWDYLTSLMLEDYHEVKFKFMEDTTIIYNIASKNCGKVAWALRYKILRFIEILSDSENSIYGTSRYQDLVLFFKDFLLETATKECSVGRLAEIAFRTMAQVSVIDFDEAKDDYIQMTCEIMDIWKDWLNSNNQLTRILGNLGFSLGFQKLKKGEKCEDALILKIIKAYEVNLTNFQEYAELLQVICDNRLQKTSILLVEAFKDLIAKLFETIVASENLEYLDDSLPTEEKELVHNKNVIEYFHVMQMTYEFAKDDVQLEKTLNFIKNKTLGLFERNQTSTELIRVFYWTISEIVRHTDRNILSGVFQKLEYYQFLTRLIRKTVSDSHLFGALAVLVATLIESGLHIYCPYDVEENQSSEKDFLYDFLLPPIISKIEPLLDLHFVGNIQQSCWALGQILHWEIFRNGGEKVLSQLDQHVDNIFESIDTICEDYESSMPALLDPMLVLMLVFIRKRMNLLPRLLKYLPIILDVSLTEQLSMEHNLLTISHTFELVEYLLDNNLLQVNDNILEWTSRVKAYPYQFPLFLQIQMEEQFRNFVDASGVYKIRTIAGSNDIIKNNLMTGIIIDNENQNLYYSTMKSIQKINLATRVVTTVVVEEENDYLLFFGLWNGTVIWTTLDDNLMIKDKSNGTISMLMSGITSFTVDQMSNTLFIALANGEIYKSDTKKNELFYRPKEVINFFFMIYCGERMYLYASNGEIQIISNNTLISSVMLLDIEEPHWGCYKGEAYFTDLNVIKKISNNGSISKVFGDPNGYRGETPDGNITSDSILGADYLSIDNSNGDIYLIDNSVNIRKISGRTLMSIAHWNNSKYEAFIISFIAPAFDNSGLYMVRQRSIQFYNYSTSTIQHFAGIGYLGFHTEPPFLSPPGSDHIGGSFVDARFRLIDSIISTADGVYVFESNQDIKLLAMNGTLLLFKMPIGYPNYHFLSYYLGESYFSSDSGIYKINPLTREVQTVTNKIVFDPFYLSPSGNIFFIEHYSNSNFFDQREVYNLNIFNMKNSNTTTCLTTYTPFNRVYVDNSGYIYYSYYNKFYIFKPSSPFSCNGTVLTFGNTTQFNNGNELLSETNFQFISSISSGNDGVFIIDNYVVKKIYMECDHGYKGPYCDIPITTCFGIEETNSSVCSARGKCVDLNTCNCSSNFEGLKCELEKCNGKSRNDPLVCSSLGLCLNGICNCSSTKYGGIDCSEPYCFGILANAPKVCNSKGKCLSPNNCSCLNDYFGNECEFHSCFGKQFNDSGVCSGNGTCSSINNCTCRIGYSGFDCSIRIPLDSFNNKTINSTIIEKSNSTIDNTTAIINNTLLNVTTSSLNRTSSNNESISNNTSTAEDSFRNETVVVNCSSFNLTNNFTNNNISLDTNQTIIFNEKNSTNSNTTIHSSNYNSTETYSCFGVLSNSSIVCSGVGLCISFDNCTCFEGFYGSNCSLRVQQNSSIHNNETYCYSNCTPNVNSSSEITNTTTTNLNNETIPQPMNLTQSNISMNGNISNNINYTACNNNTLSNSSNIGNNSSSSGTCSIYPISGVSFITRFSISCFGWESKRNNNSLLYRFEFENNSVWKPLKEQQLINTLITTLPIGNILLRVIVFDSNLLISQSNIMKVNVSKMESISTGILDILDTNILFTPQDTFISSLPILLTNISTNIVKNKINSIVSNYLNLEQEKQTEFNTSLIIITSLSSSITNFNSNSTDSIIDYFQVILKNENKNRNQVTNKDFNTCLLATQAIENHILSFNKKRSMEEIQLKVIDLYRELVELKSKSMNELETVQITGKLFKSFIQYLEGNNSIVDSIFGNTTSIQISTLPVKTPLIITVNTFNKNINGNNISQLIEFNLFNSTTHEQAIVSSEGMEIANFKMLIMPDFNHKVLTSCKYQTTKTDISNTFYCTSSFSINDNSACFKIYRTGTFIFEYNLVLNDISTGGEISTFNPRTSDKSLITTTSNDSLLVGLSVALPIFIFFITISIIILLIIIRGIKSRGKKPTCDDFNSQRQVDIIDVEMNDGMDFIQFEESSLVTAEYPLFIPNEELTFISKIGSGGFGTVYKSEYSPKGREKVIVAVKSIFNEDAFISKTSDFSEMVSNEAKLMRSLDHPNIVKCLGVSIKDNVQLIVMEYVDGGSLQELIYELKIGRIRLDLDEKINILIQIAKGVNYLHNLSKPIVHRDLKPGNCLITRSTMTCKLCDFGLSKAFTSSSMNSSITNNIGTLHYMAVEIMVGAGEKEYAKSIDVYSFAILMWELLFEDNPYIYKNTNKLFFEKNFMESEYVGLNGFNTWPRVVNGLRPVIPFQDEKDCLRWNQQFIFSKFTTPSLVKCWLSLKHLLQICWQPTPQKRPSFEEIIQMLNNTNNNLEMDLWI